MGDQKAARIGNREAVLGYLNRGQGQVCSKRTKVQKAEKATSAGVQRHGFVPIVCPFIRWELMVNIAKPFLLISLSREG